MNKKRERIAWGEMSVRDKRGYKYLLMAIPFLAFVFAFSYVPLFGWRLAFTDYKVGEPISSASFIGLDNFVKLLNDRQMYRVLRNTLVMSLLSMLTSPLPVLFAIMLNELQGQRTKKFVQTVTTLPNFISWIVVFGVAFSIFASDGLLNQLLEMLGLETSQLGLLGESDYAWGLQLALSIWKSLGWNSIIYLAAITGIDSELYDAAKVDGANKLQLIRHITLPGVAPTYLVLLLLSVGNLLSNGFEQYYVFMNGLVANRLEVLDYYVYKLAFQSGMFSYTIAVGMLKSLIGVFLLAIVNGISKKIRGESLV